MTATTTHAPHHFNTIEKVLFGIVVTGFLLSVLQVQYAFFIVVLGTFPLSIAFLIKAFQLASSNYKAERYFTALRWFIFYSCLSVLLVRYIFALMAWPYAGATYVYPLLILSIYFLIMAVKLSIPYFQQRDYTAAIIYLVSNLLFSLGCYTLVAIYNEWPWHETTFALSFIPLVMVFGATLFIYFKAEQVTRHHWLQLLQGTAIFLAVLLYFETDLHRRKSRFEELLSKDTYYQQLVKACETEKDSCKYAEIYRIWVDNNDYRQLFHMCLEGDCTYFDKYQEKLISTLKLPAADSLNKDNN